MARRLEEQAATARDARARQEDINQQLVQQIQGIGDQLRQLSRVASNSLESHQPTPGQPTADNSDEPSETTTEPLPREATNDLHSNVRLKEPDTFSGQRSKLSAFESQVRVYVMLNGKNFAGRPRTQAYFAASLLRGDAGKWVEPLLRRSSLLDSPPELNNL